MATYEIKAPNGKTYQIEGPEGATKDEVIQALMTKVPEAATPPTPTKQTSIFGEIGKAAERQFSTMGTAISGLGSEQDASRAGVEALRRQQELERSYGESPSLAGVLKTYEERGLLPAAGQVVSDLPRMLAGQIPQLATMYGGGKAGALLAGAVSGPAAPIAVPIGAGIGALLATLPSFAGENIAAQAQEDIEQGRPVEIDRAKAYGTAAAQAGVETVGTMAVLGNRAIRSILKLPGEVPLANKGVEELLKDLSAKTLAGGVARGAAVEIPVEIAQTVMQRWQAGQSLTSEDALADYGESIYGAAMVGGPLGGLGRYSERRAIQSAIGEKQREQAIAEQIEKDKEAARIRQERDFLYRAPIDDLTRPELEALRDQLAELPDRAKSVDKRLASVEDALSQMPEVDEAQGELVGMMPTFRQVREGAKILSKQQAEEAKLAKKEAKEAKGVSGEEQGELDLPIQFGPTDKIDRSILQAAGLSLAPKNEAQVSMLDWFDKNVVGKTQEDLLKLKTAKPGLFKGNSIKSRVLRELLTPETAAPVETTTPTPDLEVPSAEPSVPPQADLAGIEPSVGVSVERGTVPAGEPAAPDAGGVVSPSVPAQPGNVDEGVPPTAVDESTQPSSAFGQITETLTKAPEAAAPAAPTEQPVGYEGYAPQGREKQLEVLAGDIYAADETKYDPTGALKYISFGEADENGPGLGGAAGRAFYDSLTDAEKLRVEQYVKQKRRMHRAYNRTVRSEMQTGEKPGKGKKATSTQKKRDVNKEPEKEAVEQVEQDAEYMEEQKARLAAKKKAEQELKELDKAEAEAKAAREEAAKKPAAKPVKPAEKKAEAAEAAEAAKPAPKKPVKTEARERAEGHAEEVGGDVVWEKDDLALIRVESLSGKEPIYIATKGDRRTTTDIRRADPAWLTKEKPELVEAIRGLEGEAKPAETKPAETKPIQTDTPAFKRWFKGSKVVDEIGRPLIVYHGTTQNFTEFKDTGKRASGLWHGAGFYFSKSPFTASDYAGEDLEGANVLPVYLSIKNPFYGELSEKDISTLLKWPRFAAAYKTAKEEVSAADYTPSIERLGVIDGDRDEFIRDALERAGYDGRIIDPEFYRESEYVAFRATQIKSAISNIGTFDPNDPNILRNIEAEPSPAEQEGGSRLSSEEIRDANIKEYARLRRKLADIPKKVARGESGINVQREAARLLETAEELKLSIDLSKPRRDTPERFLAKALEEYDKGNISEDVLEVVQAAYSKQPQLLNGLLLRVQKQPEAGVVTADFNSLARIVRLFKDTSGVESPTSLRHELVHSLEQMMTPEQRKLLVDQWYKALKKAIVENKDAKHQEYFKAVLKFMDRPTKANSAAAVAALPDYSMYQYMNPSEYWAVNAEPLMAAQLGVPWNRFKMAVRRLFEGLKDVLGFDNKSAVYKTFKQIMDGTGERISKDLLIDYVQTVSRDVLPANIAPPTPRAQSPSGPVVATAVNSTRAGMVPGGTSAAIAKDELDRVTKLRFYFADKAAAVFQKLGAQTNGTVRDALGDPSVELAYRQADASDQLVPEFLRSGFIRFNRRLGVWEAYSKEGVAAPIEVINKVRAWGASKGMGFEQAWEKASKLLQSARENEFRKANAANAGDPNAKKFPITLSDAEFTRLFDEYNSDPEIKALNDLMDKPRLDLIDRMVEVGRISQETADEWKAATAYVPFDRLQEFGDLIAKIRPQKKVGRGLAQLGRLPELVDAIYVGRPVKNVLENYFNTMGWMMQQTLKTDALNRTLQALEALPTPRAKFLGYVSRDALRNAGLEVAGYRKGKKIYYQVDSTFDAAAFNLQVAPLPKYMELMSRFSRVLRTTITALPTFTAAQLPQDIQRAIMFSGVKDPVALTAKALKNMKTFGKAAVLGKLYQVTRKLGSTGVVGDVDFRADSPGEALLQELGLRDRTLLKSKKFGEFVHRLTEISRASDAAIRQAIYDQTIEETGDEALALGRAREIINFRTVGAGDPLGYWQHLVQTVPFMNAYAQGMDVLARFIMGKGAVSGQARAAAKSAFWRKASYLMGANIIYAMAVAGEEEYENMELEKRDKTYMIGSVGGVGVGIPVASELGMLFKAIPERVLEAIRKNGTPEERLGMEAVLTWHKAAFSEYVGRLSPFPVAVKPALEALANFSFRTYRPIEGIGLRELDPSQRFTYRTSELAISIADWTKKNIGVEVSPMMIDNTLNGYFGTTASLMMAAGDQLLNPDKTDRPLYQMVGLTPFTYSPVGTRYISEFYDLRDKVVQAQNTLNRIAKTDLDAASKYYEENKERLAMYNSVNSLLNQLQKTRAYKQYLDSKPAQKEMSSDERLRTKEEVTKYEQEQSKALLMAREMLKP